MSPHRSSTPQGRPKRRSPRRWTISFADAVRARVAEAFGVPEDEVLVGEAPRNEPWRTPLDRVTHPREPPTVTPQYAGWLAATLADLERHYAHAYLQLANDDPQRELFLGAARVLAVLASAMLRSDGPALGKLAPTAARVAAIPPVRVPTRLYGTMNEVGNVICDQPYWVGGRDPALTRPVLTELLIELVVARLKLVASLDDGTLGGTRRLAADMAREVVRQAGLVGLLRGEVSPSRLDRLAKRFAALLDQERIPRWHERMSEAELRAAVAARDVVLRDIAPRFAQEVLVAAGQTPKSARAVVDFVRKRAERGPREPQAEGHESVASLPRVPRKS